MTYHGHSTAIRTSRAAPLPRSQADVAFHWRHLQAGCLYIEVVDVGGIIEIPPRTMVTLGRHMIGRPVDIDLSHFRAHDYGVSRVHARIVLVPGGYDVIDLYSSNGTYLNGIRLEPGRPYRLHDRDELRLGELVLHIMQAA